MKSIILALGLLTTTPKMPEQEIIPQCMAVLEGMNEAHVKAGHESLSRTAVQYGVMFFWGSEKEAKVWASAVLVMPPGIQLTSDTFRRAGSCVADNGTTAEYFTAEYPAN